MVPLVEVEADLNGYIDHFGRRKVDEVLSEWEMNFVCDTWAKVKQCLRDSDKEEYLKRHVLALLNQHHVYDAHASILFDQRLSIGVHGPFCRRMNIYKKCLATIFGSNLPTGTKMVAKARDSFLPCAMPDEILLVFMAHSHFNETTSGIKACPLTCNEDERSDFVAEAKCPVVLLVLYSATGGTENFSLYISGVKTFSTTTADTAVYYYLTAYYVFHVSPKGTTDTGGQLVNKEREASRKPEEDRDMEAETEGDPPMNDDCDRVSAGGRSSRMGVSRVVVNRKRPQQVNREPTQGPSQKKKGNPETGKPRVVGKRHRQVPTGMYDLTMSLHVMGKVLLNVMNSYSLEMDKPMVASAKTLENKILAMKSVLEALQEKNCDI